MRTTIQTLAIAALLSCSMAGGLVAADGPAKEVAALQQAMAGDDAGAKKTAIRALASKSVGKDDDVLPLLIGAIGDRQAGEAAVAALASRIGKTPRDGAWKNNVELTQRAWQEWLEDWKKTQALKKIEKKDKKPEPPEAVATVKLPPPPEGAATGERTVPTTPAEDLGKLDRVTFKAGGSLLCFIMSKRTDADGALVSVRVVHPDGAGEETIAAALIAHIDEDIQ